MLYHILIDFLTVYSSSQCFKINKFGMTVTVPWAQREKVFGSPDDGNTAIFQNTAVLKKSGSLEEGQASSLNAKRRQI
jgi:cold shock CspA family protein